VVAAFRQALALALLTIGAVLALCLRSLRDSLLVLAPLLLAGLLTAACLRALGIAFDFANVIALPLLLGIGVDSAVHLVHRARALRASGENPLRSSTARGVLYSGATTLLSFAALAFSPHPGTARMGVALALGVTCTLLTTLVLLPAWLVALDRRGRPREEERLAGGGRAC
jgi:predicted RND superfamily exporter protein